MNKKTYTAEEVRELLGNLINDDSLIYYDVKDVKEIFKLESEDSARRLMNLPNFPSTKIGRKLIVNKVELKKFIEANKKGHLNI